MLNLLERRGRGGAPRRAFGARRQHVVAAHVHHDIGQATALLEGQHDLAGKERVAEKPLESRELSVDESANPRGDIDVTASEDESHEAMRPKDAPAGAVRS